MLQLCCDPRWGFVDTILWIAWTLLTYTFSMEPYSSTKNTLVSSNTRQDRCRQHQRCKSRWQGSRGVVICHFAASRLVSFMCVVFLNQLNRTTTCTVWHAHCNTNTTLSGSGPHTDTSPPLSNKADIYDVGVICAMLCDNKVLIRVLECSSSL